MYCQVEQQKLLKLKEQSDSTIKKLNSEIQVTYDEMSLCRPPSCPSNLVLGSMDALWNEGRFDLEIAADLTSSLGAFLWDDPD